VAKGQILPVKLEIVLLISSCPMRKKGGPSFTLSAFLSAKRLIYAAASADTEGKYRDQQVSKSHHSVLQETTLHVSIFKLLLYKMFRFPMSIDKPTEMSFIILLGIITEPIFETTFPKSMGIPNLFLSQLSLMA
jgi:hypothetical protein